MTWQKILPGVHLWRDSCNVYAIEGEDGMVMIDAGTGQWLDRVGELPLPPAALLCTHYFRDHSAGALPAARAGIPVYVPEGDRHLFADPVLYFHSRQTYIVYDNIWEHFAPIEAVPLAGVVRDYETVRLAGLEIEIIPLPGVCVTQCGFKVRLGGKTLVFCGEAIHSPGRLARVAPLQYNYNGLPGAVPCVRSAERLRRLRPDALLPSLGGPMLTATDDALAQLQASLKNLCAGRPELQPVLDSTLEDGIKPVTENVWLSVLAVAKTTFLRSKSGRVLAIDYGYNAHDFPLFSNVPGRKRALLHSLDGLEKHFGTRRIDTVLVSHFHDDHVCGIPTLQRLFGTECWVPENFADLLAQPEAHCFPCDWPVPINVTRRLPLHEKVQWEEFTFHFAPMSGHTRFAALIGFEADGRRFAHTGDQYFFQKGWDWDKDAVPPFADNPVSQNHVYRNGSLLDGYAQSTRWMLDWKPDIVTQGHQQPFFTDADFFRRIEDWTRDYENLHRAAMALGDGDAHFNLDGWGGWIWPYRVHLPEPGPAAVRVTVRNPLPRAAQLEVRLVGRTGWAASSKILAAPARGEVSCELEITPTERCRRHPFAVELTADGQPFGQVAEALITVGGGAF